MREKTADRFIGITVTFGIAASIFAFASALYKKIRSRKNQKGYWNLDRRRKEISDAYHRFRYVDTQREEFVWHSGACHCGLQQFEVFAARQLVALETPSALRYPYILVQRNDFKSITSVNNLKCYTVGLSNEEVSSLMHRKIASGEVTVIQDKVVSAHLFCPVCGTHVMHAPSMPPEHIHINVHCLRMQTVESLTVAFYSGEHAGPGVGKYIDMSEIQGFEGQNQALRPNANSSSSVTHISSTEGTEYLTPTSLDSPSTTTTGPLENSLHSTEIDLTASLIERAAHPAVQMVQYMTQRQNGAS